MRMLGVSPDPEATVISDHRRILSLSVSDQAILYEKMTDVEDLQTSTSISIATCSPHHDERASFSRCVAVDRAHYHCPCDLCQGRPVSKGTEYRHTHTSMQHRCSRTGKCIFDSCRSKFS